jgi:hypothetical protein
VRCSRAGRLVVRRCEVAGLVVRAVSNVGD